MNPNYIKIINASLIYVFSFLIFLITIGTDIHYIGTYFIISFLSIIITTKFAIKKYNELNVLIGGALLYLAFFLNITESDLEPLWFILGFSIGSTMIYQTILLKHRNLIPLNIFFLVVFALVAFVSFEFIREKEGLEFVLEAGILLSYFALLLSDQKTWSRLIVSIFMKISHPAQIKGIENVPDKEPLIFVCNHPSFYDQFILEQCAPREMFIYGGNLFEEKIPQKIRNFLFFHNNITEKDKPEDYLFDAKEKLKKNKTIAIFPEASRTKEGVKMNPWNDDIKKLLEQNPFARVLPVVIKDIKNHYHLKYNEQGEIIKIIPAHYFKPIQVEFGKPLKITKDDVDNLNKVIQKMGKDRI